MNTASKTPSARFEELLDAAYAYVQQHGLTDVSLRPLAKAIGTSPRVLLYLFGSKDGMIAALLARSRREELDAIIPLRSSVGTHPTSVAAIAEATWQWLSNPRQRPVLIMWAQAYTRSLIAPDGPWRDFAAGTVDDWLELLGTAQSSAHRDSPAGRAECTAALATLRGALLDLLATGDADRVNEAVRLQLELLNGDDTFVLRPT